MSEATQILAQSSTWVELLSWWAKHYPDRRAVTFLPDGETESDFLTYGELDRRARVVASKLQQSGAKGERVLLVFNSGLEYVVAFFGCLYAGAIAVPAYPPRLNQNLGRIESIVADCTPVIALTTADILKRIAPVLAETALQAVNWLTHEDCLKEPDNWQQPSLDGDSIAFLQYTSGSTSAPKGVMVTHRNLLSNHQMIAAAFEQTDHLAIVLWLPLFHDMGLIGNLLQTLSGGNHCIIMPPEAFLMKPVRWLKAIDRYRAYASGGPNFAYDLCAQKIRPEQSADLDLSCWKLAFCGAEPIRTQTLNTFTEAFTHIEFAESAFYPCYGLAESTLFVSGGAKASAPLIVNFDAEALEQNRGKVSAFESEKTRTMVSCGWSWLEGEVRVVDAESLTECPANTVGEIWVRGPHVTKGYWNRPEETKHYFEASTSDGDGPFLRTGDLGLLHDGELYVTGRLKDLIISGGRNHYPADIEKTVEASHPALRLGGCAAFSLEVENAEALAIVAEVERTRIADLDVKNVIRAVRQSVAEQHGIGAHTIKLIRPNTLPKTSSGKIQHYACREQLIAGTLNEILPKEAIS